MCIDQISVIRVLINNLSLVKKKKKLTIYLAFHMCKNIGLFFCRKTSRIQVIVYIIQK
jgi:hypothetical protein